MAPGAGNSPSWPASRSRQWNWPPIARSTHLYRGVDCCAPPRRRRTSMQWAKVLTLPATSFTWHWTRRRPTGWSLSPAPAPSSFQATPARHGRFSAASGAVGNAERAPASPLEPGPRQCWDDHGEGTLRRGFPTYAALPLVSAASEPTSKLAMRSSARTSAEWSSLAPPLAAQELNSSCVIEVLGKDTPSALAP